MDVKNSIRTLRIIALLLFITPTIGLLGSLIIHNYFVSFNFTHEDNYNFKENIPGSSIKILCTEENNYCDKDGFFKKFKRLDDCYKYKIYSNFEGSTFTFLSTLKTYITNDGKYIDIINPEDIKNFKENIFYKVEISNKLNENCILNTSNMAFYNIFPLFYEAVYKIKINKKTSLGTSNVVNPLLNGETSISNIVKRFPLSYFFKPVLYLSVILMIFYWLYYNRILKNLLNSKSNYYFFTFGILSAFFLFFHVLFLGWTFENEILTKLRRSLVVFFILFELLAQTFLLRKIFLIKDKINVYLNLIIVYSKLIFILLVCSSTVIILTILIFHNLDAKIDYILEWNYFLLLLLFYFLSFLMWKKKN